MTTYLPWLNIATSFFLSYIFRSHGRTCDAEWKKLRACAQRLQERERILDEHAVALDEYEAVRREARVEH